MSALRSNPKAIKTTDALILLMKVIDPSRFMSLAVKEARAGMRKNQGGPFGAVVVRNGRVVARAHNEVLKLNDPTAHAEVLAIRMAAKKLKRFDLGDCEIYSTCEPCPMCLAAIHWAKMKKVFFGCGRNDAAAMGFDDREMYDLFRHPAHENVELVRLPGEACAPLLSEWRKKRNKKLY